MRNLKRTRPTPTEREPLHALINHYILHNATTIVQLAWDTSQSENPKDFYSQSCFEYKYSNLFGLFVFDIRHQDIEYNIDIKWNSAFHMLNNAIHAKDRVNKFLELQTDFPQFIYEDQQMLIQIYNVLQLAYFSDAGNYAPVPMRGRKQDDYVF